MRYSRRGFSPRAGLQAPAASPPRAPGSGARCSVLAQPGAGFLLLRNRGGWTPLDSTGANSHPALLPRGLFVSTVSQVQSPPAPRFPLTSLDGHPELSQPTIRKGPRSSYHDAHVCPPAVEVSVPTEDWHVALRPSSGFSGVRPVPASCLPGLSGADFAETSPCP